MNLQKCSFEHISTKATILFDAYLLVLFGLKITNFVPIRSAVYIYKVFREEKKSFGTPTSMVPKNHKWASLYFFSLIFVYEKRKLVNMLSSKGRVQFDKVILS